MYDSDDNLSDDAPDDVTFQQSKDANRELTQLQLKSEKSHRHNRKLRNKKKEDLFKEQKKAKKARLAEQELPAEVLDGLSDDEGTTSHTPLISSQATHTQFGSDEESEQDDIDSGINSTITSKISVKEVEDIKSKAFSSALVFQNIKSQGANPNIQRCSAKARQFQLERKKAFRNK